jgi:23S rRNA (cytosine1962-C5)-methyltransferase
MNYPKITIKKGKESSLYRRHPWLFSGAIAKIEKGIEEGEIVEVRTNDDEFIAIGYYQIGSIAVRVLSFDNIEINQEFWNNEIQSAYNLRIATGLATDPNNNVYRLVHGEGDSLPGLIVDYYAGTAVVQFHTVAMYLFRDSIVEALKTVLKEKLTAIYNKSEKTLPFKADVNSENGYLFGDTQDFKALENGLTFNVDWLEGQKTGFFVDQRDNRSLLEKYSKGRDVLNMFCYTGGFSFYAMRGGANLVHSVDSSARAIEVTKQNVELNFPNDDRHEAYVDDAFNFLNKSEGKYDVIILDPPAFAKHKKVVTNAIKGYKKLNRKGFEVIKPGGIIFTFSCSQVISKETFRQTVFTAAANVGRKVRVLHQLQQPTDHPVSLYHPEGEYLKGLVLYVE